MPSNRKAWTLPTEIAAVTAYTHIVAIELVENPNLTTNRE